MGSRVVVVNGREFNTEQWVDGVEWEITELTGMGDPAVVNSTEQKVAQDGETATTSYRASRVVGLVGVIRATDEVRAELAFDELRSLISLEEFPLTLRYASGDRTVWVRRDGELAPLSRDLPNEFHWSCVLKAVDPAIYAGNAAGSGTILLSTRLPFNNSGVTFPATFPVTFAGTSASGDLTVDLAGGGKFTFRIDGPVTDPLVSVENSAGLFTVAWLGSVPEGMWLDVDPEKRSALLQGQASRPPNVRRWPRLARGQNIIRFRSSSYSAAVLTVTIRPTL